VQRGEIIRGKDGQHIRGAIADVARQKLVGARVKSAVELDGTLQVGELRVGCLAQDALIGCDAGKDIAQQHQCPACGGRVARLAYAPKLRQGMAAGTVRCR